MTLSKIVVIVLFMVAMATPAHARTRLIYIWRYPPGVQIAPELVSIALTGGDITAIDKRDWGGRVFFTNTYDRACYRVTIYAANRVYQSVNESECFRVSIPLVHNGN
jgi:hypothetical protein